MPSRPARPSALPNAPTPLPRTGQLGGHRGTPCAVDLREAPVSVESETTSPNSAAWRERSLDIRKPCRDRMAARPLSDRRGEGITETQPVGQRAKSVQAEVRHDTAPTGLHLHADCAGTVYFGSVLLKGDTFLSTQSLSLVGGDLSAESP